MPVCEREGRREGEYDGQEAWGGKGEEEEEEEVNGREETGQHVVGLAIVWGGGAFFPACFSVCFFLSI